MLSFVCQAGKCNKSVREMKRINSMNNISRLKADYEAGIESKIAISKKHGISAVTLWRHAQKGEWNYGRLREEVLE